MTDKLTEMRRDLERGLAYWRGETDDSDVQCERCLAEHLPALLELAEAVMAWWEAEMKTWDVRYVGTAAEKENARDAELALREHMNAVIGAFRGGQ